MFSPRQFEILAATIVLCTASGLLLLIAGKTGEIARNNGPGIWRQVFQAGTFLFLLGLCGIILAWCITD